MTPKYMSSSFDPKKQNKTKKKEGGGGGGGEDILSQTMRQTFHQIRI